MYSPTKHDRRRITRLDKKKRKSTARDIWSQFGGNSLEKEHAWNFLIGTSALSKSCGGSTQVPTIRKTDPAERQPDCEFSTIT
jgi:hypothetical protein